MKELSLVPQDELFTNSRPSTAPDLDQALARAAEILRPHCGTPQEKELLNLATAVFLEGARFGLAWVEARDG